MTDQELAEKIRAAIYEVASLMNEARPRNIVVNFNIPEAEDMRMNPPTRLFAPIVEIKKIIPLLETGAPPNG